MLSEHRAIYEAIRDGDKLAAMHAVVNHLDGIKERLKVANDSPEYAAAAV